MFVVPGRLSLMSLPPSSDMVESGGSDMRAFLVSCVVAAVLAIGGMLVLNVIQTNVATAYSTTGVRL